MSDTTTDLTHEQFITTAIDAINTEISALALLTEQIDDRFAQACDVILACQGRVVVTGMGKSGVIGRKIAATFASTGTPAFFMHPGEAKVAAILRPINPDLPMPVTTTRP
jgi:arabinose-5-phosphate isomerase